MVIYYYCLQLKTQTSFAMQTEFEKSANLPSPEISQHNYPSKWNTAGPKQQPKDNIY